MLATEVFFIIKNGKNKNVNICKIILILNKINTIGFYKKKLKNVNTISNKKLLLSSVILFNILLNNV